MNREEALARLARIVDGIDQSDATAGGWWPSSDAAEGGRRVRTQLEALVSELTGERRGGW